MQPNGSNATRVWSPFQLAVFDAVAQPTGPLVVRARAGSGKTTSIIEALRHVPRGHRVLLCAFNKSIATELQQRAPVSVDVMTLHSLGYRTIQRQWSGTSVDRKRASRLLEKYLHHRVPGALIDAMSMCKARLLLEPELVLREVIRASVKKQPGETDVMLTAAVVKAMMDARIPDGTVDFDDMCFVPAVEQWPVGPYDDVFVDETQDMNSAQLSLARLACGTSGRLVAVGDDRQAIYSWRGADTGFMQRMEVELKAQVLPLSISYRCPRRVVDLARRIVPDLKAADGAKDGTILVRQISQVDWQEGDAVLSRVNAPLVHQALQALKRGLRARIQGRDLGRSMQTWIKHFNAPNVPTLLSRARDQTSADCKALMEIDETEQIEQLRDRMDVLVALSEGALMVDTILERIDRLFSDEGPGLVFSSVHRAKGLEWFRVYLLGSTFRPEMSREEANIWYVALTRTKDTLVLVRDGGLRSRIVEDAFDPPIGISPEVSPKLETSGSGEPDNYEPDDSDPDAFEPGDYDPDNRDPDDFGSDESGS